MHYYWRIDQARTAYLRKENVVVFFYLDTQMTVLLMAIDRNRASNCYHMLIKIYHTSGDKIVQACPGAD